MNQKYAERRARAKAVWMRPETHRLLKLIAVQQGVTMEALTDKILVSWVRRYQEGAIK